MLLKQKRLLNIVREIRIRIPGYRTRCIINVYSSRYASMQQNAKPNCYNIIVHIIADSTAISTWTIAIVWITVKGKTNNVFTLCISFLVIKIYIRNATLWFFLFLQNILRPVSVPKHIISGHELQSSHTGGCLFFLLNITLQWCHNERDSISNHQPPDCLLNRLLRRRSKKRSKLRVTSPCEGNSPVTGEFPHKGPVT